MYFDEPEFVHVKVNVVAAPFARVPWLPRAVQPCAFTASTVTGTSPLTVKFSDNSTGKIISRFWDFGDGTPINSEQYPVHTYTIPGDYNVRLIIRRPDNTSTIIRQSYITVIDVSNSSKQSMTNIQGENNNMPSVLTSVSNIPNDTKLSDSETRVSIANSKEP